jgi:hypothetical protein
MRAALLMLHFHPSCGFGESFFKEQDELPRRGRFLLSRSGPTSTASPAKALQLMACAGPQQDRRRMPGQLAGSIVRQSGLDRFATLRDMSRPHLDPAGPVPSKLQTPTCTSSSQIPPPPNLTVPVHHSTSRKCLPGAADRVCSYSAQLLTASALAHSRRYADAAAFQLRTPLTSFTTFDHQMFTEHPASGDQ